MIEVLAVLIGVYLCIAFSGYFLGRHDEWLWVMLVAFLLLTVVPTFDLWVLNTRSWNYYLAVSTLEMAGIVPAGFVVGHYTVFEGDHE